LAISKLRNVPKAPGKALSSQFLQRPQGAPRGLLHYYILHRISRGPTHGYEISQSIEEKTEGAWRPGAGSVYPTLKKLLKDGLIRASSGSKTRGSETSQRVYEITPKGMNCLSEGKDILANAGRRWAMMRGIFVDLMDAERISSFIVEGSKLNFQMTQEIVDSKISKLSPSDAEFTLKEYALNLERQLNWTRTKLMELEKKSGVTPTAR
jgi:DNA-binding PadR family transcriptional regulator